MTPGIPEEGRPEQLTWVWKTLVMADVVESGRVFGVYKDAAISRWLRYVDDLRTQVVPSLDGMFVKSTGDGFLLAFDSAPTAAHAAREIQRRAAEANLGVVADAAIDLRVGLAAGEVVVKTWDCVGEAVDRSHHLLTLAGPGEIMVSAEVRDLLVPGLDADVEDLGECVVKHDRRVRAYRLGDASPRPLLDSLAARRQAELQASIAVIPFQCRLGHDPGDMLGEALCEEVIAQLARSAEMNVIAGLSSRRLKGRGLDVAELGRTLGADYVLTGGYRMAPDRIKLNLQLHDVRRGRVLDADAMQYETSVAGAFDPAEPLADHIVTDIGHAIFAQALELSQNTPLPALESYSLLFGAVALMHRATAHEFDRAREMLEHLAARQGRHGVAEAWLAKWHVLRVVQGWSPDREAESQRALDRVQQSLDGSPRNALALSIGGLVHGYLRKDLVTAGHMYEQALADNPSEPLAWLFSATRHAYLGEGADAEQACDMALRLSPIDPLRYFFDSLAATAVAGNGQWQRAVDLARRSLKANRTHSSTWRTLVYALVMLGRTDDARAAVAELLRIEPTLSVGAFRDRFPGRDGPMAEPWALALKTAGVPD
jgi:adenylate cyclase